MSQSGPTVSPFCAQLTTLTPDPLARGATFARACAILRRKFTARRAEYGQLWGDDRAVRAAGQRAACPTSQRSHINIKSLFAWCNGGLEHEMGCAGAGVVRRAGRRDAPPAAWTRVENAARSVWQPADALANGVLDERTPLMEDL